MSNYSIRLPVITRKIQRGCLFSDMNLKLVSVGNCIHLEFGKKTYCSVVMKSLKHVCFHRSWRLCPSLELVLKWSACSTLLTTSSTATPCSSASCISCLFTATNSTATHPSTTAGSLYVHVDTPGVRLSESTSKPAVLNIFTAARAELSLCVARTNRCCS